MRAPLCLLSLLVTAAMCTPSTAHAADGPSATGGGLTSFAIPGATIVMQVSVNAIERGDGTVSGHLNFKILSPDFGFKIFGKHSVNCLKVEDNRASLSGVCRKGVGPDGTDLTGLCWVAQLWDNGEGAASPPDTGTGPFYETCDQLPADLACQFLDELPPGGDLIAGNIQVKP